MHSIHKNQLFNERFKYFNITFEKKILSSNGISNFLGESKVDIYSLLLLETNSTLLLNMAASAWSLAFRNNVWEKFPKLRLFKMSNWVWIHFWRFFQKLHLTFKICLNDVFFISRKANNAFLEQLPFSF